MPQIPIHVTEIKNLILKDQISPDSSLNEDQLLNVLTSNACGRNPTFFKAFGHNEVFGLKSSIPEGGTVVEIVEKVPVEGAGSPKEPQYRQEGVLYVHLPDGHPIITGSAPSDDEPMVVAETETFMPEELSLDPLNMEAEVTIDDTYPEEMDQMQIEEDPLMIVVEVEEPAEKSSHEPEIITLDDEVGVEPPKTRRHNLRPQRTNKHLHALKQQVKRRKKNTNLTAGIPLPQRQTSRRSTLTTGEIEIPFKPFPTELNKDPKSMKEVLSSIPGFNHRKLKLNNKNNKKLSLAQMVQQTKEGGVNLESPESILGQVNLRTLLNKSTFSKLPPLYQFKLIQLLPQTELLFDETKGLRLNSSAFNNEFFAKACHEWRERLLRGDFTPEALQKSKNELDSDKRKFDPWKAKHFEPIWGMKKNYDLNKLLPKIDEMDCPVDDRVSTELKCDIDSSPCKNVATTEVSSPIKIDVDEKLESFFEVKKTTSPSKSPRVKITEHFEEIKDISEPLSKRRKLNFKEPESASKRINLLDESLLVLGPVVKAEESIEIDGAKDSTDSTDSTDSLNNKDVDEEVPKTCPGKTSEASLEEKSSETSDQLQKPKVEEDLDVRIEQEPEQSEEESRSSELVADLNLPKQIDSRHSSSDDSISAPLLISEDGFVDDNVRELSGPPTLSPNGSHLEYNCDLNPASEDSEMPTDDDKSDLTSESDFSGLNLASSNKSSTNLRQSIDSCDSEMEIISFKPLDSTTEGKDKLFSVETDKIEENTKETEETLLSTGPLPHHLEEQNLQKDKLIETKVISVTATTVDPAPETTIETKPSDNPVLEPLEAEQTKPTNKVELLRSNVVELSKENKPADKITDCPPELNPAMSSTAPSLLTVTSFTPLSTSTTVTASSCLPAATTTTTITASSSIVTKTKNLQTLPESTSTPSPIEFSVVNPKNTGLSLTAKDARLNEEMKLDSLDDLSTPSLSTALSCTTVSLNPTSPLLTFTQPSMSSKSSFQDKPSSPCGSSGNSRVQDDLAANEATLSPPVLSLQEQHFNLPSQKELPSHSTSFTLSDLTPSQPARSLTLLETLLQQCRSPPRTDQPGDIPATSQNVVSQPGDNPIQSTNIAEQPFDKLLYSPSYDNLLLDKPNRPPNLLETLIKSIPTQPEKTSASPNLSSSLHYQLLEQSSSHIHQEKSPSSTTIIKQSPCSPIIEEPPKSPKAPDQNNTKVRIS